MKKPSRRGRRTREPGEVRPVEVEPPAVDEIDRKLIELLVADVRASNKELAKATSLSPWTVASRLKRLREANLLVATVLVDSVRAGFEVEAFAFVRVDGSSEPMARALVGHRNVRSVVRTFGAADVVVNVIAEDSVRLRKVCDEIGDAPGVASIHVQFVVGYHRMEVRRIILPVRPWAADELPRPVVELDELDRRLIARLVEDGHQSNRDIARQLDVSEGTIRTRLRRLEDSGLLRVAAMGNPFVLGEATAAYFALSTRGAMRSRVVDVLARRSDVTALASCLGSLDLVGLLVSSSHEEVARALDEIRGIPGVREAVLAPLTATLDHRSHLVRLL